MRKLALLLLLAAAAAPAQDRGDPRKGPPHGPGWADPGDVLAAEIAFSRLAQEKGQWTAFRATAAPNAQQFDPGPVRVEADLKGRKDPAIAVKWQPHAVWMACDGSYAVTRGAWQGAPKNGIGGATGWFITVWQRQKKGDYKWVLDQGDTLKTALEAPEFLTAKVADCPPRKRPDGDPAHAPKPAKADKAAPPPDYTSNHSDDGTLAWTTTPTPKGHHFSVTLRQDGAMAEVTAADVAN